MKPISGKEFARHRWKLLRISGSHHIYGKPGTSVRLSIPIHGSQLLKAGLQRHLSKLAGLDESLR